MTYGVKKKKSKFSFRKLVKNPDFYFVLSLGMYGMMFLVPACSGLIPQLEQNVNLITGLAVFFMIGGMLSSGAAQWIGLDRELTFKTEPLSEETLEHLRQMLDEYKEQLESQKQSESK